MEKKVVLIVLIVIAVVAFMFLGAGVARGRRDPDVNARSYRAEGSFMEKLDSLAARWRKPFDRSRMVVLTSGCTFTPEGLIRFSGECGIVIKPSRTKSSAFYLKRGASRAEACYAFSNDALRECWADSDKRSELTEDSHRFVVTGDSAFMQLRCTTVPSGQCGIAVALKD